MRTSIWQATVDISKGLKGSAVSFFSGNSDLTLLVDKVLATYSEMQLGLFSVLGSSQNRQNRHQQRKKRGRLSKVREKLTLMAQVVENVRPDR